MSSCRSRRFSPGERLSFFRLFFLVPSPAIIPPPFFAWLLYLYGIPPRNIPHFFPFSHLTFPHNTSIIERLIGVWRSLVSRLVRVQEAWGSNPHTPTKDEPLSGSSFCFSETIRFAG